MPHPSWCDLERCRAGKGGPHVGGRLIVEGPVRPLAAVWVEGPNGDPVVRLSVAADHAWSHDELRLLMAVVSAADAQLTGEVGCEAVRPNRPG